MPSSTNKLATTIPKVEQKQQRTMEIKTRAITLLSYYNLTLDGITLFLMAGKWTHKRTHMGLLYLVNNIHTEHQTFNVFDEQKKTNNKNSFAQRSFAAFQKAFKYVFFPLKLLYQTNFALWLTQRK